MAQQRPYNEAAYFKISVYLFETVSLPFPVAHSHFSCGMVRYIYMEQNQEINLENLIDRSHENKWVAIAPDYRRVLASADSLGQLMSEVSGQDVVFHRVLPRDVSFVPASA